MPTTTPRRGLAKRRYGPWARAASTTAHRRLRRATTWATQTPRTASQRRARPRATATDRLTGTVTALPRYRSRRSSARREQDDGAPSYFLHWSIRSWLVPFIFETWQDDTSEADLASRAQQKCFYGTFPGPFTVHVFFLSSHHFTAWFTTSDLTLIRWRFAGGLQIK